MKGLGSKLSSHLPLGTVRCCFAARTTRRAAVHERVT